MPRPIKQRCPYCFELIHPGDCAIFSERDGTVVAPAPQGLKQLISRFRIEDLTGPFYTLRQSVRQCPNCSHPWPRGYEFSENHIIAILGSRAAGVSTSIPILIQELRKSQILQALGAISFSAIDQSTEASYEASYGSLLRDKQVLPPTQPGFPPEPLIYQLRFATGSSGKRARTVNLLFYDAATEDVEKVIALLACSRFIFHASAVIFLADPTGMPGIRNHINQEHHQLYPYPAEQPEALFNRVVGLYDQYHGGKPFSIPLPLAITIPKSDFLEAFDPGRRSVLFAKPAYTDPAAPRRRWLEEFEKVNSEVRRVLNATGETALLHWSTTLKRAHFFAIAPTGHPPNRETATYPAIEPIRVLEPLLWILWQLGVIEIK